MKLCDYIDEKLITIVCGGLHSLALTEMHHVRGWGSNKVGQLGFLKIYCFHYPKYFDIKYKIEKIAWFGALSLSYK
jgi:alpha-tubulin suppressor-like RCC1 family protein